MKDTQTITLTYKNAQVLGKIIVFMYTGGPPYYYAGKSLSEAQKDHADTIFDHLVTLREKVRETNPELFVSRPYPTEALNKTLELTLTEDELSMILTIFVETLRESADDNFHDLEVIVGSSLEDVRNVYGKLKKAGPIGFFATLRDNEKALHL